MKHFFNYSILKKTAERSRSLILSALALLVVITGISVKKSIIADDGSIGRGFFGGAATGALVGGLAGGGRGAGIGALAGGLLGAGIGASRGSGSSSDPYRQLDKERRKLSKEQSKLSKMENRLARTTSERKRKRLMSRVENQRMRVKDQAAKVHDLEMRLGIGRGPQRGMGYQPPRGYRAY